MADGVWATNRLMEAAGGFTLTHSRSYSSRRVEFLSTYDRFRLANHLSTSSFNVHWKDSDILLAVTNFLRIL